MSWLFAETEHPVEFRALTHDRSKPARSVFTRDIGIITAHLERLPDRDHYYGVATRLKGAGKGAREHLAELPAVWADVDTGKLGLDPAAVIAACRSCPCPPSGIIASGGGLHLLWRLKEPVDLVSREADDEIEAINRQLIGVWAGDAGTHDLPRVLRLPGTINLKYEHRPVCEALELNEWVYELSDLADWLAVQRPLIEAPAAARGERTAVLDPFTAYAAAAGYRPPVDVESRLRAMTYLGHGEAGVHQTQLAVSAHLVAHGIGDDEIVAMLVECTRAASGEAGTNWNWRREEREIRRMVVDARKKGYDKPRQPAAPPGPKLEATNGRPVIDLAAERARREADEDKHRIVIIGEMALIGWQVERGPLVTVAGEFWTYGAGFWQHFEAPEEHALRVMIMGCVNRMKFNPEAKLLNGAYRWLLENPALARYGVTFNRSGLIVCRNGAIDPTTGSKLPHSPDLWATYAIDCDIDPAARCDAWLAFWQSCLRHLSDGERTIAIDTLGEWFGAALVRGKSREMTKALIAYGPSRTGKTQVAMVARALVGGRPSGIRARSLLGRFGMEPLLYASAWIADDAVSTGEYLDAECFKVLVTGEPTSVERKGKTNVEQAFDLPIMLTANHLPRVKDQSEAVYNRSLILPMTNVFPEDGASNRPLYETFLEELPGILNWAIAGYRRLLERRRFAPPPFMRKALADFENDNNPLGKWLAEAIEPCSFLMVDRRDLLASYRSFCREEFGEEGKSFGPRMVIKAVREAVSGDDHSSDGARYMTGVKLTQTGIDYVERARELAGFGTTTGSGKKEGEMNRSNPKTQLNSGKTRF